MKFKKQKTDRTDYTIEVNKEIKTAIVKFHGKVGKESLESSFVDLLSHEDFVKNANACYNYSNAYFSANMQEIEKHAQFVNERREERGDSYKLAFVTRDKLTKTLLEIYKLLIAHTAVEVKVFTIHKRAVEWIEKRK
ncbi:MAG: STAS/SEC14 domain-containing protein [Gammaproteobacteria bacterium]|nr:STAS/SEC14 domain-containing protein [Gammaproteobacteria bacterium]MDH5630062.1 STAS/SEC14 domain-containing protein [Gammaproteobacteria bacterium]